MTLTAARDDSFGLTATAYCLRLVARGMAQRDVIAALVISGKCRSRAAAHSVFTYATRKRPRKWVNSQPGDTRIACPLSPAQMERLQIAADARDMAPCVLAHRILCAIIDDDMFNAVLDDQEARA